MKTVSNVVHLYFYEQLKIMGVNPQPLFKSAGIHYEELTNADGRIDSFRHYKLLELITPRMGGVADIPEVDFNQLCQDSMPLASACGNAPSLRGALNLFFEYRGIIGECDSLFQKEAENEISFIYRSEHAGNFRSHCGVSNFLYLDALIKHYYPQLNIEKKVTIASNKVSDIKALSNFLDCSVIGTDCDTFTIPSEVLDIKNEHFNPILQPFLLDNLNTIVNSSLRNKKISSQIIKIIKANLWQNADSSKNNILNTTCQSLSTTRSTLSRKLQKENTSFSLLLTQFRREQACRLLRKNEMKISDISDQLGFINHSSFSRFFNEQFNQSPANFRKINATY